MEIKQIKLSKFSWDQWSLSVAESNIQIPFDIKRVYYIYDLKNDENIRWEHAHYITRQVLFCINWSFRMWFDDWIEKKEIILNEPNIWVYIPEHMWHYMTDFSDWCILLVFASEHYDEKDYIRSYNDFINLNK